MIAKKSLSVEGGSGASKTAPGAGDSESIVGGSQQGEGGDTGRMKLTDTPTEGTLTPEERTTLRDCEAVIERGLESFAEVATALMEIHDQELYRAEYTTFAQYCKQKWGVTPSRAYRRIAAAKTAAVLPRGNIPQAFREKHLRPLNRFSEADRSKVWADIAQKITINEDVKAGEIARVVDDLVANSPDEPYKTVREKQESRKLRQRGKKQARSKLQVVPKEGEEEENEYDFAEGRSVRPLPPRPPVLLILENLNDGEWHPLAKLESEVISPPEKKRDAWLWEVRSAAEQKRRVEVAEHDLNHAQVTGERIIWTSLGALVWLGLVEQDGEDESAKYRIAPQGQLIEAEFTRRIKAEYDRWIEAESTTCPTCGGHEFEEDGDCAKCHEPGVHHEDKSQEGTQDA